ncbi:unnamed protein product [Nezara viridula]|uniref:Uncharacterized protein n=1 Tax=Nezara viridula TaxID=85310 RepID=A0A9P0HG68_NEZVI|nr:unnamed protein product [Nezara viridula]
MMEYLIARATAYLICPKYLSLISKEYQLPLIDDNWVQSRKRLVVSCPSMLSGIKQPRTLAAALRGERCAKVRLVFGRLLIAPAKASFLQSLVASGPVRVSYTTPTTPIYLAPPFRTWSRVPHFGKYSYTSTAEKYQMAPPIWSETDTPFSKSDWFHIV